LGNKEWRNSSILAFTVIWREQLCVAVLRWNGHVGSASPAYTKS
jgi:hypothetical protein